MTRVQRTTASGTHALAARLARAAAFAAALLLAGCGGEQAGPPDAGPDMPGDAGVVSDSGVDAGAVDASEPDMGVDAGTPALGPVLVDIEAPAPPDTLSAFRFFTQRDGTFDYNDRVVPYALSTALFSDYAIKERALYVPPGETVTYTSTGTFAFPAGSAIIKTFLLGPDLANPGATLEPIETRVLIRHADGWRAYPYVWRADGSDADYFVRGDVRSTTFIDPLGQERTAQYLIPQRNQCLECHELKDEADERFITIIGPRARYLNRIGTYPDGDENQLLRLERLGLMTGLPDLSEVPRAFEWETLTSTVGLEFETVERAARNYLDINCAHCHRPNATQGITSRLFLNYDNQDVFNLGFCKEPGSAGSAANGRRYDIVPGDAEASILIYRTETEVVGDMMPLLGRSLSDTVGVRVLRGWVDGLEPDDCQ